MFVICWLFIMVGYSLRLPVNLFSLGWWGIGWFSV